MIGAFIAAGALFVMVSGKAGWEPGGFASNGFGALSPGGCSMGARW